MSAVERSPVSPRPERPRRQPVARHGILKSPHPLSQVLAILAAVVAVAVISTTAVGAFYVWDATRAVEAAGVSIGGDDEQLPPTLGEIEGGVNMLVVGTDSCEGPTPRCPAPARTATPTASATTSPCWCTFPTSPVA